MINTRTSVLAALALAVGIGLTWNPPEARSQDAPPAVVQPPPADSGLPPRNEPGAQQGEPLARGPIHEAFAQPTPTKPQAGPIVPKKPPEPIPEQPPDQKPEGENVQWVPGYWFWAPDKKDFIWVSGFWRVTPPGRRWVPGYWTQVDAGWQWTPGFWAAANQTDLQYLPAPPPSMDNGPSVPAPDDQSSYVPGSWVYQGDDYVWQPGYWTAAQPDYIYTPAYYSWTPSGYVYVNGYWDYALANRGLLFAPVSFDQPYWATAGWYYRPWCTVGIGSILDSLFCWPSYSSYCFGDYYNSLYATNFGIYPWWWWGRHHGDPLFRHLAWRNRFDRGWFAGLRNTYWGRFDGTLARPPRTFREQRRLLASGRTGAHLHVLTPLNRLDPRTARLGPVSRSHLNRERQSIRNMRELSAQRARTERAGRAFRLPADARAAVGARSFQQNRLVSPGPLPSGRSFSSSARPRDLSVPGPMEGSRFSAPRRYEAPAIRNQMSRGFGQAPRLPQIYNVPHPYRAGPSVGHFSAPTAHFSAPTFAHPHAMPAQHFRAPAFHAPSFHAPASHGGGHGGGGHAGGGHHR